MENSHDELMVKNRTNNFIILLNLSLVFLNLIVWVFFFKLMNAFTLFLYLSLTGISIVIVILLTINYLYRRREIRVLRDLTDFSNRHEIIFKSSSSAMRIHKFIEESFSSLEVLTVEDKKIIFIFNTGLSNDEMNRVINVMKMLRKKLLLEYNSIEQIRN